MTSPVAPPPPPDAPAPVPLHRHPIAGPLAFAGAATLVGAIVLFLCTFWFFFAFLWALPAAAALWEMRVAQRLARGDSSFEEARRVAQLGLFAAILAGANPVAIGASLIALRRLA